MKPGAAVSVATVCLLSGFGCQQPPPSSPAASAALNACNSSMKALDFAVSRVVRLGFLAAAVNDAQVAARRAPVTWDALASAVRALQQAELQLPQPVLHQSEVRPGNGLVASAEQVRAYEQAVAGVKARCAGVLQHP